MSLRSPPWIVSAIYMTVTNIPIFTIITYSIFHIIRSHLRMVKYKKSIFCTALSFMFCNWLLTAQMLTMSICVFITLYSTINATLLIILNVFVALIFLIQNYCLLIALFARLSGHFRSGPVSLSKCTVFAFTSVLTIIPVLCFVIPVVRIMGANALYQRLLVMFILFLITSTLSGLLAVFTWKLKQIQKNKTLNAFIRRQIILAVLTVITNLLCFIPTSLRIHVHPASLENEWISFIETFLLSFNILFNFLSIAISYRVGDSLIVLCCGCCRCCRVIPITTTDHDAVFLEQIMKNASDHPARRTGKPTEIQHEAPSTKIQSAENEVNRSVPVQPQNNAQSIGPAVNTLTQKPISLEIVYEY